MGKFNILLGLALLTLPGCGSAEAQGDLMPALHRLAEAGDAEAIYHVGMAFHTGSGLPKDRGKALAAFRRAAALGDPLASYKLGCFYDGQGEGLVEEDVELALRHKLVAAKAGYALAQQDAAMLYAARQDIPTALDWLEKAAAQGWPDALMAYASVHNGAAGVPPDPVKTAAYFRIFLDRSEAGEDQRAWLKNFERKLSPAERKQAADIARNFRPAPTALTIKALSGQRAAEELVARRR